MLRSHSVRIFMNKVRNYFRKLIHKQSPVFSPLKAQRVCGQDGLVTQCFFLFVRLETFSTKSLNFASFLRTLQNRRIGTALTKFTEVVGLEPRLYSLPPACFFSQDFQNFNFWLFFQFLFENSVPNQKLKKIAKN